MKTNKGAKAAAFALLAGVIVLVVALNLALIAGALWGGYKAWVAFGDGREGAALAWGVLCVFCATGVLHNLLRDAGS